MPTLWRCEEPNGFRFIDKEYTHLCGACAQKRDTIYEEGYYRWGKKCAGCDSVLGAVNYFPPDGTAKFYCARSAQCIP